MKRQPEESWETIKQQLLKIKNIVEERYPKILENPALYGPELGFTNEEHEFLEETVKLLDENLLTMKVATERFIEDMKDKDDDPNSNHPQK